VKKTILLSFIVSSILYAETTEEILDGFDDDVSAKVEKSTNSEKSTDFMEGFDNTSQSLVQEEKNSDDMKGFDARSLKVEKITEDEMDGFTEEKSSSHSEDSTTNNEQTESNEFITGLTGKFTEQVAYSYNGSNPHDGLTSLKSSLFLDYEHKFENGWRMKTNARAYYDVIYDYRDDKYTSEELDAQRSEVELFDAYLEGSITENIDMKIGRQVVVWGRSDTIRITDILNPLDNRRPGMVDIEDLRLATTMLKFDFFWDNWRVTPIAVLEQRFSKNPAFGSAFSPAPFAVPEHKNYTDATYALSVGAEFSGWDINFYAAQVRDDAGYIKLPLSPSSTVDHDKITMFGTALNVLSGAWLFKSELAYFDGLKYTSTQEKEFSRTDLLLGLEYKGIADTLFSYDISLRHFNTYDNRLSNEIMPTDENTYQHAFRVSSDFLNATLTANYLISLYGKKLDEGGFQRAWVKYELGEGINMNFGVVDYIGGSKLFDSIKDNDMVFVDISYSF
jgi:hypothetical protein